MGLHISFWQTLARHVSSELVNLIYHLGDAEAKSRTYLRHRQTSSDIYTFNLPENVFFKLI